MSPKAPNPIPQYRIEDSDCPDVLATALGTVGPDTGLIEWLFDRIKGRTEGRTWA